MIGNLVQQPAGYKAFIPNDFPGNIEVDMNNTKLTELHYWATHYLAKLDGVTQVLPDLDFFIFMYVRKEAASSSQIEGTKATMSDSIRAEAKISLNLPKDVSQIQNYIKAMNYGLKRVDELPLSLRLVREIHSVLLSDHEDKEHTPGEFRRSQNWIGGASINTARFIPPPVTEMNRALSDFEKFLHSRDRFTPLIKTAILHAQFETIHPFLDGNGRTGRLLITFYLDKLGVLEKPVLYLSAFFRKHRSLYFDLIDNYHSKNEVEPWLKFFLEGIIEVSKDAIKVSKQINSLRSRDELKIHQLGKASEIGLKVLRYLYKLPIIDIGSMTKVTGYTRQGANRLLNKFLELEILELKDEEKNYARQFVYSDHLKIFTEGELK